MSSPSTPCKASFISGISGIPVEFISSSALNCTSSGGHLGKISGALTIVVGDLITGDREQPIEQFVRLARAAAAHRLKQNVLQQILGIRRVAHPIVHKLGQLLLELQPNLNRHQPQHDVAPGFGAQQLVVG